LIAALANALLMMGQKIDGGVFFEEKNFNVMM
jgi:hypothetical protein